MNDETNKYLGFNVSSIGMSNTFQSNLEIVFSINIRLSLNQNGTETFGTDFKAIY